MRASTLIGARSSAFASELRPARAAARAASSRASDASRGGCRSSRHVASSPSSSSSSSSDVTSLALEDRKSLLLRLCANTDRGKSVTPDAAKRIEELVAAIEASNVTRDPAVSPLISGEWSLVYTGASAKDAAERAKREGVIGRTLTEVTGSGGNVAGEGGAETRTTDSISSISKKKPLPLGRSISLLSGAVENRGNFQDIDAARGVVENRAELSVFGVRAEVKIEASCVPAAPSDAGGESIRLDVAFRRVAITLGPLPPLSIPLTFVNDGKGPQGWLDTTFLDDTMRLGRGDKGSTFVTVRRG